MQVISTVTQKGQVTIPKNIREAVGISEYDKVLVAASKHYVKIIPTRDILDFAGSFSPRRKKPLLKARESFERKYHRF